MDHSSPNNSPSFSREFISSFAEGVTSTASSMANVFNRSTYSDARRQAGQFMSAISNPSRSFATFSDAVSTGFDSIDTRRTVARTGGDMAGSAATIFGATMLGVAALRRPYLATRFGQRLSNAYGATSLAHRYPFYRPPVRNFLLTRPLAMGIGVGVGAMSFIGGASTRAETAVENRATHPQTSSALRRGGLDEVLATPLSRVVNTEPKI